MPMPLSLRSVTSTSVPSGMPSTAAPAVSANTTPFCSAIVAGRNPAFTESAADPDPDPDPDPESDPDPDPDPESDPDPDPDPESDPAPSFAAALSFLHPAPAANAATAITAMVRLMRATVLPHPCRVAPMRTIARLLPALFLLA